ncbi:hypothetical protein LS66_006700 [Helicobacter sp. MIT 03-1614]|uniref:Uncharacterized protein n=1 Tax=Helicobacter typhlonius TaxID=76936 RepID=A0A099UGX0_9HELI|nr:MULTISPECIES: hypothetical protein [Helicobacter]TLD78312.1 hypothetical protein LS75_006820 [Helicobacter typhlonius]TLD87995.1 hypothetical protein LS66_006700 [Helicobacter sp. MIT 03-1614]CUU38923.1 Hypothetical protein BN2458_PEG0036 [Helicobacter typhlonius]
MSSYATQADLFVELAKPDKNGVSRWVYVSEFVGKYEPLSSNNGYAWARDGSRGGTTKTKLNETYIIEKKPSTGEVVAIRLNGFKPKT